MSPLNRKVSLLPFPFLDRVQFLTWFSAIFVIVSRP
jgi:hypothetical protein